MSASPIGRGLSLAPLADEDAVDGRLADPQPLGDLRAANAVHLRRMISSTGQRTRGLWLLRGLLGIIYARFCKIASFAAPLRRASCRAV